MLATSNKYRVERRNAKSKNENNWELCFESHDQALMLNKFSSVPIVEYETTSRGVIQQTYTYRLIRVITLTEILETK